MRRICRRYLFLGTLFLLCTLLVVSLLLGTPRTAVAPSDRSLTGTDGEAVASVPITGLKDLNVLSEVNYTPDEFLQPNSQIQGTPVDLTRKNNFARRGTFVFVIRNIDPASPDFLQQSEALAPYLQGDGSWHFSLYIPLVWSACNIYVRSTLALRVGEIAGYDFIQYTDYSAKTESHADKTEPVVLDLSFYPKQYAISPDPLQAATVVTIHYESSDVQTAGIEGIPLIGAAEDISDTIVYNRLLAIVLFVFAALISAMFIFVCILKRNLSFMPNLGIVFGIFGVLLSSYALSLATPLPFFWKTARTFMLAFTLLSAFHILRDRKFLFRPWLLCISLFAAYCLSVPVLQILPFDFSAWQRAYRIVCILLFSCVTLIFTAFSARRPETEISMLINPLLAGILGIASCFSDANLFALSNPVFWICALLLVYTTYLGGSVFLRQEKKLNYLTKNLQSEIQTRTKEMKEMIEERDKILRYASHDMKKPLQSMEHFLIVLKDRERDPELKKTVDILERKVTELMRNLTDLAKYSKNNFAAEESKTFDLNELLDRAREDFEPDCIANGIHLKILPCKILVYAKYNSLYSAVGNVILNAIEHARCRHIQISALKKKEFCLLSISDDGKGLDGKKDIFYPYYSESSSANNTGIGLYISRNFMRSMNGDLTYKQEEGKLTFFISIPLA